MAAKPAAGTTPVAAKTTVPVIAVGAPTTSDNHTLWLALVLLAISCCVTGTVAFRLGRGRA